MNEVNKDVMRSSSPVADISDIDSEADKCPQFASVGSPNMLPEWHHTFIPIREHQ